MFNLFSNKKAQLMALEIKLFLIGFGIGLLVGVVAVVLLSIFGILPDFIMNFLCNCGA